MTYKETRSGLSTCIVFGTNPRNDLPDLIDFGKVPTEYWRDDEGRRAARAVTQVQKGTKNLICVGGETFINSVGDQMTEAASMQQRIGDEAFVRSVDLENVQFITEEAGRETLEQVENVIAILAQHDLMHGAIGIISSWQQVPRVRFILRSKAGLHTKALVANPPIPDGRLLSQTWNCVAGLAYTALVLEMQRRGKWTDGGPVISHYRTKRSQK